MQIITEVTNENKDRIAIVVEPLCDYLSQGITYRIDLVVTQYKKRKSIRISYELRDDYKYRNLEFGSQAREDYVKAKMLEYVTEEQIQEAVNKAYEALKPTADNLKYH